jgi:hypothetical protein
MNIKKRKMLGLVLMAVTVLAAIVIQALTGRVLEFDVAHTDFVSPNTIATDSVIVFHWRYAVPLAAAFVIGLVCCVWPTRKPPRIIP